MKRILLLIAGPAGFLVGLGFILPAVALWRSGSPDTVMIAGPLLLGGVLIGASVFAVHRGLVRPHA